MSRPEHARQLAAFRDGQVADVPVAHECVGPASASTSIEYGNGVMKARICGEW
jgi:hypothetical protein